MTYKRLYKIRRIIVLVVFIIGAVIVGCTPTLHYPKILTLGFVNEGFEISVLDLNNATRQYFTNSKIISPISFSYCKTKKQVAFSAFINNGEELTLQDLVDLRTKILTQGGNHFRFPVWSPDCSMLAFTSYDNITNVFILNPENLKTYPVVSKQEFPLEGASWSPNSHFLATHISTSLQNKGSKGKFDLGIADITNNKLTARIQGLIDYPFSKVVWNADSNKVYFSVMRDTPSFDIYAFDLNKNIETPIIQTKFDDHYPMLSPDGKYLSFLQSSSVQDSYTLGLIDLSSKNTKAMTTNPMSISETFWLDSQRIIFSEHNLSEDETIYYVLDIKTKSLKEISRFNGFFIESQVLQP
jgi:Tol biopolymer transport system component